MNFRNILRVLPQLEMILGLIGDFNEKRGHHWLLGGKRRFDTSFLEYLQVQVRFGEI